MVPIVQTFEAQTYDRRLAWTARPQEARRDIAIVEIDDQSLRALEPLLGPVAVAALSARRRHLLSLARTGARDRLRHPVSGADVLGRYRVGDRTITGAESDAELVAAVRRAGNVVLLGDATTESQLGPPPALPGTIYQPAPASNRGRRCARHSPSCPASPRPSVTTSRRKTPTA